MFSSAITWFLFILHNPLLSVYWSLSSNKHSFAGQLQHTDIDFCVYNIFSFFSLLRCLCGTFICTDTTWGGGRIACVCQAEQYSYLPQLLTYQVEIGAITLPREGGWFWAVPYSSLSQLSQGLWARPLLLLLFLSLNKHQVIFVIM